MKLSQLRRTLVAAVAALTLTVASLTAPAAAEPDDPAAPPARPHTQYTADALPTVQVNGVVWDQIVAGNVVYAVGQFTSARPAGSPQGSNETPRSNILAYDLNTGELITDFAPRLNGAGRSLALSDDGRTLYVAGSFDKVDDEWHGHLAAFDLTEGHGRLIPGFRAFFSTTVNTIDVAGSTVYAGGAFTKVNGVARLKLAAVDATTGSTLEWSADAEGTSAQVYSLVVSPDASKVAVGGSFRSINGYDEPGYGLALLSASDGSLLSTPVNSQVRAAGNNGAILDLQADATGFYGAAYSSKSREANLEGTFKADWDGNLVWIEPCHGDSYSIYPSGDQVFVANHAHSCETIWGFPESTWQTPNGNTETKYYRALAFTNGPDVTIRRQGTDLYTDWSGYPSPQLLDWYPDLTAGSFTGQYQAAYDITGTPDYLLLAGEFTAVDGKTQQGLVRLPRRGATASHAPQGTADDLSLTASSHDDGTVSLSYTPTWDRDDTALTYSLYRDNEATAVDIRQISDRHWEPASQQLVEDAGVPAGTHTYRLVVSDAGGNKLEASTTVEVSGPGQPRPDPGDMNAYDAHAAELGASHQWTFDETGGNSLTDLRGGTSMTADGGIRLNGPGAYEGSRSVSLSGDRSATATASTSDGDIQQLTIETWISTTSQSGGPVVAYRNQANVDRMIYMDSQGRLTFGVYPGQVRTISSPTGYNDGQWHHVAATLGPNGMALYIDGQQVAADPSTTRAQSFNGYWSLGVGSFQGWPGQVWSPVLQANVDGITIYPTQLSAQQIAEHYSRAA